MAVALPRLWHAFEHKFQAMEDSVVSLQSMSTSRLTAFAHAAAPNNDTAFKSGGLATSSLEMHARVQVHTWFRACACPTCEFTSVCKSDASLLKSGKVLPLRPPSRSSWPHNDPVTTLTMPRCHIKAHRQWAAACQQAHLLLTAPTIPRHCSQPRCSARPKTCSTP